MLRSPRVLASLLTYIMMVYFSCFTAMVQAEDTPRSLKILQAGTALIIPGEDPVKNISLIIEDGKITEMRQGFISADSLRKDDNAFSDSDITVINRQKSFVMPGFIDLHVHVSSGPMSNRESRLKKPDSYLVFTAYQNAYKTLMAGFTTIRDLGSRGTIIFGLRDAIKDNLIAGPKILVAGSAITPTGGHGDAHGYRQEFLDLMDDGNTCDGADDCRRAVRAMVKRGADVIKVTATGGVLSKTGTGTGQQFTQSELNAIAEAAHWLGRKVTAHAHEKEGIEAALRAGFDSIEHSMWADKNTMKLFKKTGAWIVPTVYPITYVGDTPEKMKKGPFKDLPPVVMKKLLRLGKQPKKMTRMAHNMGVKIALGTDSGVSPHGDNANEFIEYVGVGMTPMESLMAGTVNAAEAAGITNVGKLTPGMAADIVAMDNSPLDNISAVLDLNLIMRDGLVFKSNTP